MLRKNRNLNMKRICAATLNNSAALAGILFCFAITASVAMGAPLQEARVSRVIQDVRLLASNVAPRPAVVNDNVQEGTAVRTGVESRAELTFSDQTITRLGQNTVFSLKGGTREMTLDSGALLLQVPQHGEAAQIRTAAVTASISGGTGLLSSNKGFPTKLLILEGTGRFCSIDRPDDCVEVQGGEMVMLMPDGRITKPTKFNAKLVFQSSHLLTDFPPLPNEFLILEVINEQQTGPEQTGTPPPGDTIDETDQRAAASPTPSETPGPSATPTPTPSVTPTPTPSATPTPTPSATPTPTPSATPTPTPSATPTPTATPSATPDKYGTPSVISSPDPYVIDSNTVISTDPAIATNGNTDYGKIYRNQAMDGSRSTWMFGSVSTFDQDSGFENGVDTSTFLNNIAVFKFQNLVISGNPMVSTANGVMNLGFIGVDGITTAAPGGVIDFGGEVDTFLLATQSGSINLTSDVSFENINRMFIYARGDGSNLMIDSDISTNNDLRLYSEDTVTVNGALSTLNFSSFSNGDFLGGNGLITAAGIYITSQSNITFNADQFSPGNFSDISLSLVADGTIDLDVSNDQSVFNAASSINVNAGDTLNMTGSAPSTLDLDVTSPATFSAGAGGIQAATVAFSTTGGLDLESGGDINVYSADIPFVQGGRTIEGTIHATGAISSLGNITSGDVTAGTSISVGATAVAHDPATNGNGRQNRIVNGVYTQIGSPLGTNGADFFAVNITAGTTIDVTGELSAFDTVTAGGNITANTVAVPTINAPDGILSVGSGGIRPFIVSGGTDDGANLQHTFNVNSVVSPNGIDFSGNQFGGISGLSSGGKLTINADSITFINDFRGGNPPGIAFANFNGADAGGFDGQTPTSGGSGGKFIVNTAGNITAFNGADITATTGLNDPNIAQVDHSGDGGTVELNSSDGIVNVDSTIQVSSAEPTSTAAPFRSSASGGNITITSGKTSGTAININNTAQLLSLLDAAAPGPGGNIVILASNSTSNEGNSSSVNVDGHLQADRGTVDIRHMGSDGMISLSSADVSADVIKIAALGTNGVLTVGGGQLSADSTLKLYAPGSNGQINFVADVTLHNSSANTILAANAITISNGVVVTTTGHAADVYVNSTAGVPNANYTGSGGNGSTTGMFGGLEATDPQPLASAPPLGPSHH